MEPEAPMNIDGKNEQSNKYKEGANETERKKIIRVQKVSVQFR